MTEAPPCPNCGHRCSSVLCEDGGFHDCCDGCFARGCDMEEAILQAAVPVWAALPLGRHLILWTSDRFDAPLPAFLANVGQCTECGGRLAPYGSAAVADWLGRHDLVCRRCGAVVPANLSCAIEGMR